MFNIIFFSRDKLGATYIGMSTTNLAEKQSKMAGEATAKTTEIKTKGEQVCKGEPKNVSIL